MNAYCDHCGKETSHTQVGVQITWCAGCIKDNADLLGGLELEVFSRPRIDDAIIASAAQSFGFPSNISKLKSVPKKKVAMKLQDAKIGDKVRIVGNSSYDGCEATIIADDNGNSSRALAIKSSDNPPKENCFVKLKHDLLTKSNHSRVSDQEIEQFDKYLWFPGNSYQVEVISSKVQNKIEKTETVEVLESEDKMAVNVNTLQAGQEIDHPKHGRMIVLGTYAGSGERLLGKKEKFDGATQSHPKNPSTSYAYWDKFDGTNYWLKWFVASEQVDIVGDRILKFGVKVGDKVEIFRKKSYDGLMDSGYEADLEAPKVVGTVVGFNANGEPNVYLDEPGTHKDRLNGYNSTLIDKTFLENKSFADKVSKNPNNFWLIRTDKAFNKLKERHMETKQERPAFLEMMKGDATNAAYRVASMQMTKGIKSGILAVLEKQGTDGTKLKAISEMLDTEFGTSLVSLLLGVGLQYIPKISEDPRAQKLASEFRVGGIAVAGNMVVDVALEHFLPVITGALNALPPQETAVRVAETPKVETNNQLSLEQAIREEAEKADEKTDQVMKA